MPVDGGGRKVLYVINEAYFFLSHRLAVARAAQRQGFEVHVATPTDHVWAPDGFSLTALADEGFVHHPIPLSRRGTNPFREVATLVAIWRLFRRLSPDLVHLMTIKPVLYGGIAARLAGVPAVAATITGLGQMFVAPGGAAAALRVVAGGAYRLALAHRNAGVTFQNREDLDRLVGLKAVRPERAVLIRGSGVALDEFVPTPEPEATPLVVMPARLIWEKGVGDFVAAARILRGQGVTARFALIGNTRPSNPRAVPESQLRSWCESGAVEWWGRREDMPAIYAACHVVCQPSKYGEGVPKVLIEALACGRAVIASDIAGCREVIRHDENGLLVPPGDPAALAAALRALIDDPARRRRLGRAGRTSAEAEFGIERVTERTLAMYGALLAA